MYGISMNYCRFHGKGFLQTQTWKNKIAWFASSCWLCFSSNNQIGQYFESWVLFISTGQSGSKEKESQQEEANQAILFFQILVRKHPLPWIWEYSARFLSGNLNFPAEISLIRFPDKVRIDFINLFYFLVQRCDWFCYITELWFEILDNFWLVVDF